MKRKALCFILTLLAIAVFSLGCGGGGGSSNPASSNVAGFARVSGAVYDSSNNPVANANVRLVLSSNALINSLTSNTTSNLRLATNGNQTEFNTNTDNKGEYTFVNVPYGEYTLSAVTANGAQIVTKLEVNSSVLVQPDMTIMPFGTITGNVKNGSDNVSGAIVYIDGTSFCSVTDNVGSYTLTYVPASSTPYVLKVYAPSMKLSQDYTVEAVVPTDNTSDSIIWKKDLELVDDTSILNSNALTINLEEGKTFDSDLMLFAVSSDNTTTYAGCIPTGKTSCTIYIKDKGNYKIIPAFLSKTFYIFAHSFVGKSGDVAISEEDETISVSGSGSVTITFGTDSNSSYGTLNLKVNTTGNFTACLFDSTGHENKLTISGTGSFKNLVPGQYALAVYSEADLMLKVKTGITISKGENSEEIEPVNVMPDFTSFGGNTGCATATLDFSSASPVSSDSDGLYFSILSINDSGTTELYDDKMATTTFKVTSSKINQVISLDNISSYDNYKSSDLKPSDSVNAIKFFFKNGLNKNVFEKSFSLGDKSVAMSTDSYKTISLNKDSNGNPISQNNVIYFKTISLGEEIGYLVVTSDSAYLYSSKSEIPIRTYSFDENIKQGNVCYIDDANLLVVQFLTKKIAVDSGETVTNLNIVGCLYDVTRNIFTQKTIYDGNAYKQEGWSVDTDYITKIISPNKLMTKKDGSGYDIISLSDDCIRYFKVSNLSELPETGLSEPNSICYFGTLRTGDFKELIVVATSSTIINNNGELILYYLATEYEEEFPSDAICLVEGHLSSSYNSVNNEKIITQIGNHSLSRFGENDKRYININDGNGCTSYYLYDVNNENNYPLSMTDCLDNTNAETKLFFNNTSNVKETKLVYSNSIYAGTNIKSSFTLANNYEAWIERYSDGQHLILRNTDTYKEQKIKINQVLNINGYLEGSMAFTTTNGNQIHVLCADENGNIKVMVLNLIKGIN